MFGDKKAPQMQDLYKVYLGSAIRGVLFNFFTLFYFRVTIRSCVIIDLQNIDK